MAAETDRLMLSNSKVFKIIQGNLSSTCTKTKHIVECKDDILYVWNELDTCVLTLNTKTVNAVDGGASQYQTLSPTDPPAFDVERLLVNETASQLVVFGPHGVAVFDLPRRWGKDATFNGGKSVITCRCRLVDERFFACNPHVEVRQARWHPGSPGDSHLLVLTSDNTFRLYETGAGDSDAGDGGGGGGPKLCQVWPLGRTPVGSLSTAATRMPLLASLGDTAVDFDFTHPVSQSNHLTKFQADTTTKSGDETGMSDTLWPILVLRGNGDVYLVTSAITSEGPAKATVTGPLSMYPADDDNYGVDACSILCMNSEPPVVVIATCSGILYHCLLLDNEDIQDDHSTSNIQSLSHYGSSYNLHSTDSSLFVFESVELELGLTLDDNSPDYNCPIHLHHDRSTKSRYFCSHNTGVHAMSLPIISQLDQYLHTNDNSDAQHLPTMEPPSSVEYVISTCTSDSTVSPLLGLTFTQTPTMLVALLCNGEVVSLPLVTVDISPLAAGARWGEEGDKEVEQQLTKEPFDEHIRKILKHDLTQPILKFGPNADLAPKKCMELVNNATQLFRDEYFLRHDKARSEIERRVTSLRAVKGQQLKELEQMTEEKVLLQEKAEHLAEKYEDYKERQELLVARAEQLLRLLSQKQPGISTAEKKLADELKQVSAKVDAFKKSLDQIKAKQAYQKTQKQQWVKTKEKRELYLAPTQMQTTKNILLQVSEDIAGLKKAVTILKKDLSV